MAYFNQSIGGPDNGYKHLVDNSLDWGQDLPALRRWLDERGLNEPHQPVFYAYFGVGIPEREGVRIGDVEKDYLRPLLDQERGPLQSELTLCISATKWTGCNEPIPRWSLQEESRLRSLLEQLNQQKDGSVPSDTVDLAAYLLRVRVIATLRSRQPDELIAHSILVYRLSPEELRQAMHGPIPPEALPSGAKERNL